MKNPLTWLVNQLFGAKTSAKLQPLVTAFVDVLLAANTTVTLTSVQALVNNNLTDLVAKAAAKVPGASIFSPILVMIFEPEIDSWVAGRYTSVTGRTV